MSIRSEQLQGNSEIVLLMETINSERVSTINNAAIRVGNLYGMGRLEAMNEHELDIIEDVCARDNRIVSIEDIVHTRSVYTQIAYHALTRFEYKLWDKKDLPFWEDARTRFEKMVSRYWKISPDVSPQENIVRLQTYTEVYAKICRSVGLPLFARLPEYTLSSLSTYDQKTGNELDFTNSMAFAAKDDVSAQVEDHEAVQSLLQTISELSPQDQSIILALASGYREDELVSQGITPEQIEASRQALLGLMNSEEDGAKGNEADGRVVAEGDQEHGNGGKKQRWAERWKNMIVHVPVRHLFTLLDQIPVRERLAIFKHTRYYLPEESVRQYITRIQIDDWSFFQDLLRGMNNVQVLISKGSEIPYIGRPIPEIINELDRYKPVFGRLSQLQFSDSRITFAAMTEEDKAFVWRNLNDPERKIALFLWDFIDDGKVLRIRYTPQEIADETGISLTQVHEAMQLINRIHTEKSLRPVNEKGIAVRNDSNQYMLIEKRPNLTVFDFARLTKVERELIDYLTLPNGEGRYHPASTASEMNPAFTTSVSFQFSYRFEKKPWKVYRMYTGARRELAQYDASYINHFKAAMAIKRSIGAGIPTNSNLKVIAEANGLNAKQFHIWIRKITAKGYTGEPHIKEPYRSVFSGDTLDEREQAARCDFTEYDAVIAQYPHLENTLRYLLVKLDHAQEFFSHVENPLQVIVSDGQVKKRIVRHKFREIFDCYPEALPHLDEYNEQQIIQLIESAEKVLGTYQEDTRESFSDIVTCTTTIQTALQSILIEEPIISRKKIISKVRNLFGMSEDGLDRLVAAWQMNGFLPKEVTTFKRLVEYVYLNDLIASHKDQLQFLDKLPDPAFTADMSVVQSIQLTEHALIDTIAQKAHELYERDGIYFGHDVRTKTKNRKELSTVTYQALEDFFSQLRDWGSSFSYEQEDILKRDMRNHTLVQTYIQRAIEKAVEKYNVMLSPNPYKSTATAYQFMYERLQRAGITKAEEIPVGKERGEFEELFLIDANTLRYLCDQEGVSFSTMLDSLTRTIDQEYAESARLYRDPTSLDEVAYQLAVYAYNKNIPLNSLTADTFFNHFPIIQNISDPNFRKIMQTDSVTRTPLRTLAEKLQTTPSDLVNRVKVFYTTTRSNI